nr:vegetative cell wall protein gp1-like [Aegilops tauschii subsp. strangulata]
MSTADSHLTPANRGPPPQRRRLSQPTPRRQVERVVLPAPSSTAARGSPQPARSGPHLGPPAHASPPAPGHAPPPPPRRRASPRLADPAPSSRPPATERRRPAAPKPGRPAAPLPPPPSHTAPPRRAPRRRLACSPPPPDPGRRRSPVAGSAAPAGDFLAGRGSSASTSPPDPIRVDPARLFFYQVPSLSTHVLIFPMP